MKIQRKLITHVDDLKGDISEDGKKVFRLKNILPTGKIAFTDDKEKIHVIDAGNEFDITESELEELKDCQGFKEGFLVYSKIYQQHDEFCNFMSDEKITQLIKLPLKKFEFIIKDLDSYYAFERIKKLLVDNHKASGYLQFVSLREADLKDEYVKSQKYETDKERNKRIYQSPVNR